MSFRVSAERSEGRNEESPRRVTLRARGWVTFSRYADSPPRCTGLGLTFWEDPPRNVIPSER